MATQVRPIDVSVLYPGQPVGIDSVASFARVAIAAGVRRLWMGQSLLAEPHQVLAHLAGMGISIPVGIGVTLMPLRNPFEAAIQARSLALVTGHPVVVGYGTATPGLVAGLRGAPYRRPAAAAAGYASAVASLLAGKAPSHECEACIVHPMLPVVPHPLVEVGLGVLRPAMARMAGTVADVAVTWMTPPEYVRDVLRPALAEGAAGKRRPPRIATIVHVALAEPRRDPWVLALAAAGAHLSTPHYTDMLRRAGIAAYPDNPTAGAAALVEAGAYVYGTPDEVVACIARYQEAGVDEVILNVAGVVVSEDDEAGLADLREILRSYREFQYEADGTTRAESPRSHRQTTTLA